MALTFPSGNYLNTPIDVDPDAGGQTRAMLLRNRILVTEAGIRPTVLTFNGTPTYPERRRIMLERGLLLPEIDLLNLYDWYREREWPREESPPAPLEDLRRWTSAEQTDLEGRPWRRVYEREGGKVYDYLRPDGSPFLRLPAFVFRRPATWPERILRIAPDGTVQGSWTHVGDWFREWIATLAGQDPTYCFVDSRFIAPLVLPLDLPRMHMIYVLHNIHVAPPRRWSSPTNGSYFRLLPKISDMHGMVTLTDRQREDLVLRRGPSPHLHVVPNPVDAPTPPDSPRRDPHLAVAVARLEPQKRLDQALRAFALVRAQVPQARLDVYGGGSLREDLQRLVDELGLGDAVTLKGHDPAAREALWRASAFLMTSEFEGYPLSTLESLSHGCPVVSYDIKYGPREQITDGRDGFLVEPGDLHAFADKVVQLLSSTSLVSRMSDAARDTAARHDAATFTAQWRDVVQQVTEQRERHVAVSHVRLHDVLCRVERGRWPRARTEDLAPEDVGSTAPSRGTLRVQGRLEVEATEAGSPWEESRVTVSLVHPPSGGVVDLDTHVEHADGSLRFEAAGPARLTEDLPRADGETRLRVRLNWFNYGRDWHFPAWNSRL